MPNATTERIIDSQFESGRTNWNSEITCCRKNRFQHDTNRRIECERATEASKNEQGRRFGANKWSKKEWFDIAKRADISRHRILCSLIKNLTDSTISG